MKKLMFAAVAAVALVGCRSVDHGACPADEFTFASWNIGHYSLGMRSYTTLAESEAAEKSKAYRDFIDEVGADVFGVTEYSASFTSNGVTKANSAVFGRYRKHVVGPHHDYMWNAHFWNGCEFIDARTVEYPQHDMDVYYVATRLKIAGKEVVFVETHLDWRTHLPGHENDRKSQLQMLVDDFRNEPHVVIAGDFNVGIRVNKKLAVDNPAEYDVFVDAGFALGNDGRYKTAPAGKLGNPGESFSLDNIIVKGLEILEFRVFDRPDLSDHALVCARLKVN